MNEKASWRAIYATVLIWLAAQIALMTWFTRIHQ